MSEFLYSEKLYRAIGRKNPAEVRLLLAQKGNVNSPRSMNPVMRLVDYENIYPLEKACKTSYEMAMLLLEAGADASLVDSYIGSTALIYALSQNYGERFELAFTLIEKGAVIDQVDDIGRTAVNKAAVIYPTDTPEQREKEMELMAYLLEACDLETVLERSSTNPLVEAARFDNIPILEYILDEGLVDINRMAGGYTALMKAVLANCKDACRLLLERGADTTLLSAKGKTAADYAMKRGDAEIISMLS